MAIINNNRTQVACDLANEGWETIRVIDRWHPWYRELIQNSRFNICAICFSMKCRRGGVSLTSAAVSASVKNKAKQILAEFEERIAAEMDAKQGVLPSTQQGVS